MSDFNANLKVKKKLAPMEAVHALSTSKHVRRFSKQRKSKYTGVHVVYRM